MASGRVLYFAGLREALGLAEEVLELPADVRTVKEFCNYLAARHIAYAERRLYIRVARNELFAHETDPLAEGDVLALIPPVAGG